jgi:molybdopterin/thiamine biosynthesis adenylyltransferase
MVEKVSIGEVDGNRYDRSKRIPWLDLEAVFKSRVLMIGAGAIGNEVAKNLALAGFRKITVVDMDHVVGSNLNRCLFFTSEDAQRESPKAEAVCEGIRRLSNDAAPKAVNSKIEDCSESMFASSEIVLGCLDNVNARLHANAHSYHAGRPYIDGGMEGFLGKVMVALPPGGACLQCGMNRSHAKVAEMRFSCTGKDVVFHEPRVAAEITTTSVISAIMVREALKLVSGRRDMVLSNALYYDGQKNVCEEMEVELNPACPNHVQL